MKWSLLFFLLKTNEKESAPRMHSIYYKQYGRSKMYERIKEGKSSYCYFTCVSKYACHILHYECCDKKNQEFGKNNSPKIRFDFASFFPRDTRLINDSLCGGDLIKTSPSLFFSFLPQLTIPSHQTANGSAIRRLEVFARPAIERRRKWRSRIF